MDEIDEMMDLIGKLNGITIERKLYNEVLRLRSENFQDYQESPRAVPTVEILKRSHQDISGI